ncbi:MAG: T9SS C-terminal target domain-containing protein [Winogradskyella sp.]|uniref:FG-GAP-like repeat-containing protein n=1 Tax=Winogradskyella sp. TaxID=1883156 RepID=UPI000F41CD51|nr:FG-GAP-like repeat-containing protein [Winogradskyella sp.]RNC79800.1 MAG: T9SS C-terminal target domain-containing protein [Winogradskyella sp.]
MWYRQLLICFFISFTLLVKGQTLFEDEALTRGIDATTNCDGNGLGISFADFDNDGLDDITVPTRNNEGLKFYKNFGGIFVEQQLLTPAILYPTRSVSWVDYDNDGDRDLFVVSDSDGNKLFNQASDGTFSDVTISSGLFTDNVFTFSVTWGDINNDGCLDLFFSNRTTNTLFPNFLFQNNCDGTFSNISSSAGISSDSRLTFGASFFDFNNDGFQDIYLINDKVTANRLYKNDGDGTFTDVSASTGAGITIDAMSVTIDDYNSDGFLDIYITNTDIQYPNRVAGNVLLQNVNGTSFSDVSSSSSTDLQGWCWGANFLDAENDADLDLYVSCLYVSETDPDSYGFYENQTSGFSQPTNIGFLNNDLSSYGTAIGDADNNGMVDILVVNDANNLPNLWMNKTNTTNNYLSVSLNGTTSNKDGIGSRIEISINGEKQYRYLINGESYISQNSFTEYFGVGAATIVDYVKVTWLSGVVDILNNVSVNQKINITEGSTLSTANYSDNNTLAIYPNPANNRLFVNAQQQLDSIIIYNTLGQQILQLNPNSSTFDIDISGLESGIYFIKTAYNEREVTSRLIKN